MSEARLNHHLTCLLRVLTQLRRAHVHVYGARLDVNHPRPVVYVGHGPYGWRLVGFGQDQRGCYTDYAADMSGVELRRRVRGQRTGSLASPSAHDPSNRQHKPPVR